MKKILSIIAASAMILAMVGCEITIEPKDFEAQTKELLPLASGGDTAYNISNVTVTSGNDCLEVVYTSSKITFKTVKEGKATVTFESKDSAKIAKDVRLTVGSDGKISNSFEPLKRCTYNSTSSYSYLESWWADDTSTKLQPDSTTISAISDGYYYGEAEDPCEYLWVQGNVFYWMQWSKDDGYGNEYKWARGVVVPKTDANGAVVKGRIASINWTSSGIVFVNYTSKKMEASKESSSLTSVSIPSYFTNVTDIDFAYTPGTQQGSYCITFNDNDSSKYTLITDFANEVSEWQEWDQAKYSSGKIAWRQNDIPFNWTPFVHK